MATQLIQFIRPITISYRDIKANRPCYAGGRSGGSNWDGKQTVKPNQSNQYVTDEYDGEEVFGLRSRGFGGLKSVMTKVKKKEMKDLGFSKVPLDFQGIDGGTIVRMRTALLFLKVFRAFGWMLPAIMISLLLRTGPNAIIMAIALPLAQSALSLAADALWGRSGDNLRPKSKGKKWTYTGATSNTRVGNEKGKNPQTRKKEAGDYRSWAAANNVSAKSGKREQRKFGGWDELDRQTIVDKV